MFQPQTEQINQLIHLLGQVQQGHSHYLQQLEALSLHPDYPLYLAHILQGQDYSESVRSISGLSLKNCIAHSQQLDPYLKDCVLRSLKDQSLLVRNVGGSIITTCVTGNGNLTRWPELLPRLLELLQDASCLHVLSLTHSL